MAEQRLNVSVDNGKYTVIMEADGRLHALRYGEPWQDLCGNNLVYFLAAELEATRKALSEVVSKDSDGVYRTRYIEDEDLTDIVGDVLPEKNNG